MKRFLIVTAAVGLTIALVGVVILRGYLRSARVTEQVTTQLEAFYGGPVRVGSVDVGLTGTTIRHFALYEEGTSGEQGEPWLKIDSIDADVSLWDVVNGNSMPKRVTLTGAKLTLRFDGAGNLITNFPPPSFTSMTAIRWELAPEIDFEHGEVVFRKEGHADLAITKVAIHVARKGDAITVSGNADSVEVGKLILTGSLDEKSGQATVRLRNEAKVHVTQAMLDRIPFVPDSVWDEIQIAAGDATARLTLTGNVNQRTFRYRIELSPENVAFSIPSLGLTAERASGRLTIDDNVIHLRDGHGQAFGGQFRTNADLHFQSSITKMTFGDIVVEDFNAADLPTQWGVPARLPSSAHAKLDGNAALEVTITAALFSPAFVAESIAAAGSPCATPPIALLAPYGARHIEIKGRGKGRLRDPSGRNESVEFDWQFAPQR